MGTLKDIKAALGLADDATIADVKNAFAWVLEKAAWEERQVSEDPRVELSALANAS